MEIPALYRTWTIERENVNVEARTVDLSFSSEQPVERFFGAEILDHKRASIRLDRLRSAAPLLMDHDGRDVVGVVEKVSIGDRRGRAVVRFGRGVHAEEIFADVQDGIRTNVSVGYKIHAMQLESSDNSGDVFRITDWEPFELSLVGVGADPTVGTNRVEDLLPGQAIEPNSTAKINYQSEQDTDDVNTRDQNDQQTADAETQRLADEAREHAAQQTRDHDNQQTSTVDVTVIESRAIGIERKRIADIEELCRKHGASDLFRAAVDDGTSVTELAVRILEHRHATGGDTNDDNISTDTGEIGLTDREAQSFRFVRMFRALAEPSNAKLQESAAFELEVTRATSSYLTRNEVRDVRSEFSLPYDVLRQPLAQTPNQAELAVRMFQKRDLLAGTDTAGGHLIATDLLGASFIDLLRASAVMMGLGTVLNDMVGNVAIPRQTAATVGVWLATEQGGATEDDAAFDQVTMTPNEVGVFQEYARQLLVQSSIDIEAFVRADLSLALALAIDLAAINGSGASGQPTGILNVSGIGDVDLGANGGAPTWPAIVELETDVSVANAAVGNLGYLTNANFRGKAKTTVKESGQAIYLMPETGLEMNGYRASISNQVPNNLTDGLGSNLSACIFGNYADLFIALWSGIDILVNPYTGDTTRTTRVTAYQDADIAVRHPESFSAIQDADTT